MSPLSQRLLEGNASGTAEVNASVWKGQRLLKSMSVRQPAEGMIKSSLSQRLSRYLGHILYFQGILSQPGLGQPSLSQPSKFLI